MSRSIILGDPSSAYLKFGINGFQKVLPDKVIEDIGRRHGADKRRRALVLKTHFWLLVYSLCDPTIRGLGTLLGSASVALRDLFEGQPVVRALHKSALSRRNSCPRRLKCFKDLFQYLVREARGYRWMDPALRRFARVSLVDASLLDLGLSLLKAFSPSRTDIPNKAQVKRNTSLDLEGQIPEAVVLGPGNRNERKMVSRLIQGLKNALFIFDLGYWDYEFFERLAADGNFFISRLQSNAVYEVIRRLDPQQEDYLVRLGCPLKKMERPLRLVGIPYEGEMYWYVTNLMSRKVFSPEKIASTYRRRWDIERFFFHLKEILRVRRLFSRTRNGIQVEIYAALCTYLIINILMHQAARACRRKVTDLSFRKSFHFVSLWIRQRVGRDSPVTEAEIERLLLDLVIYAPAETRRMKERKRA